MSEYQQEISGASMQLLKYYHQSNDVTFTAYEWKVMGFATPSDCVAVRIRESNNGGEVTYLAAKDLHAFGGKNAEQDKP